MASWEARLVSIGWKRAGVAFAATQNTGNNKMKKMLASYWQTASGVRYCSMNYDEDNWNEEDAATQRLLNEVCKDVAVPTDDESEEAFNQQN